MCERQAKSVAIEKITFHYQSKMARKQSANDKEVENLNTDVTLIAKECPFFFTRPYVEIAQFDGQNIEPIEWLNGVLSHKVQYDLNDEQIFKEINKALKGNAKDCWSLLN